MGSDVETVEMPDYTKKGYKGTDYSQELYFPTWKIPADHPLVQAGIKGHSAIFGKDPEVDKWTFSTNGIATMGIFKLPTIGFGPANEIYAHSVNDQVPALHLIKAAAWYANFPVMYCSL